MPEVMLEGDVSQRIDDFRELLADRTQADFAEVDLNVAASVILSLGLDLMMADFFGQLDEGTLKKSVQVFYKQHPNCQPVERAGVSSNELADVHVAISRRYPKRFFTFMLEMLKAEEWAEARERFKQLFLRWDSERNGHA
ncbi:MAG TPA: hypothetical protein VMS17_14490 [Gemmataceae bacterium]|nr:hypothetical protein [Gemmataceae bacterium]